MIVSRVPAVAYCLQPTELQTDSRNKFPESVIHIGY